MDSYNRLKLIVLWCHQNISILSVLGTGELEKQYILLWIISTIFKWWVWRVRIGNKFSFMLFTLLKLGHSVRLKIIAFSPILYSTYKKRWWKGFHICIYWLLTLGSYKLRYIALCRQINIRSIFNIKLFLPVSRLIFRQVTSGHSFVV